MNKPSLKILFEDNHLIVVDKPPLLPTMGVAANRPSVVSEVKTYLKEKYQKPGNVFLGVVSRLDSHTSGVLVLARTSKAAARLSDQFRRGTVDKTYLAMVEGRLAEPAGEMTDWIDKDDAAHRMFATRQPGPSAREARLTFQTIGLSADTTLVEVVLLTGRKHQIRVQFASRGHPVVGDRKYGSRRGFRGIALLAKSLRLVHPVRKSEMVFSVTPPESWEIGRFRRI